MVQNSNKSPQSLNLITKTSNIQDVYFDHEYILRAISPDKSSSQRARDTAMQSRRRQPAAKLLPTNFIELVFIGPAMLLQLLHIMSICKFHD